MAAPDKAPQTILEQLGAKPPTCATFFYFRVAPEADGKALGVPGVGNCRAEVPGLAAAQNPLTQKAQVVIARPFTEPEGVCRHWQADERTAADHILEQLGQLIEAIRSQRRETGSGA
jgi:hypothetical protein